MEKINDLLNEEVMETVADGVVKVTKRGLNSFDKIAVGFSVAALGYLAVKQTPKVIKKIKEREALKNENNISEEQVAEDVNENVEETLDNE